MGGGRVEVGCDVAACVGWGGRWRSVEEGCEVA